MQKVSNQHQGYIYYLFEAPLSKEQSLLRRIGNVIFHILTLGIPFIIYRLVACCSKTSSALPSFIDFVAIREGNVPIPLVSEVGQNIIKASNDLIEERIDLLWSEKVSFLDDIPSLKSQLGKLFMLQKEHETAFLDKIRDYQDLEDPYQEKTVLDTLDNYIKTSYALGMTLLSRLKLIAEPGLNRSEWLSYESIFDNKIMGDMFRRCFSSYHSARSCIKYDKEELGFSYLINIPEVYAKLFYQEGSIQNGWRQLYNELCHHVRYYLKEEYIDILVNRYKDRMNPDYKLQDYRSYFIYSST